MHTTSSKYGKLGPRGRKCVFIRYPELSKGYVLVGTNENGHISEFESRDVTFIETEFPKFGEVGSDFTLFETNDLEISRSVNPSGRVEGGSTMDTAKTPSPSVDFSNPGLDLSGNVPNSGDDMDVDPSGSTIPMDIDSSGSHIPSLSTIPNLDEYRRFVYQEADPL